VLVDALVQSDRVAEARRAFAEFRRRRGDHPFAIALAVSFAATDGRYAEAESLAGRFLIASRGNQDRELQAKEMLVHLAIVQGRLAEAERLAGERIEAEARRGNANQALYWVTYLAQMDSRLRGDPARALRRLDDGARRFRLAEVSPFDFRYWFAAWTYAVAGRVPRAREMLAVTRAQRKPDLHYNLVLDHTLLAEIAEQEHHFADAIAEWRLADARGCSLCPKPYLARAFALAGMTDSAITYYRAYLDRIGMLDRLYWLDPAHRAEAYEALGRLYEERGDRPQALDYYGRFVDLWRKADPDLQPRVREAKQRMAALAAEATAN
jgi:tetratricopeptide (TPR) repeat protein